MSQGTQVRGLAPRAGNMKQNLCFVLVIRVGLTGEIPALISQIKGDPCGQFGIHTCVRNFKLKNRKKREIKNRRRVSYFFFAILWYSREPLHHF